MHSLSRTAPATEEDTFTFLGTEFDARLTRAAAVHKAAQAGTWNMHALLKVGRHFSTADMVGLYTAQTDPTSKRERRAFTALLTRCCALWLMCNTAFYARSDWTMPTLSYSLLLFPSMPT